MKKFLALALAILMMAAIAVPAFAAEFDQTINVNEYDESVLWTETRYGDHNDESNASNYLTDANDVEEENTRIEYGVAQAYTVTIPADVRLYEHTDATGEKEKGYVYGHETLSVSDVVIAGDEELNIYVSSAQFNTGRNEWEMRDTEGTKTSTPVNYKMIVDDNDAIDETKYLTAAEYGSATSVKSSADRTEVDGKATARDGLILICQEAEGNVGTTGSTNTVQLYFSSKGTAQEGTYRDVLTFTVRIQKTIDNAPEQGI